MCLCTVAQLCASLWDPMDYNPPGFSVFARILDWVAISRQEHWSGLPFPSPGDIPDPGMEAVSPALAGGKPYLC